MKLLTSIHQFRGYAEFSTWLYRLVVNACMDLTRDAAARNRNPAADCSHVKGAAPARSQEEDYARAQMATSVREAVSALPAKFRIAVLLRYFEDLSYEEMARVLHCSIGTVAI